MGASVPGQLRTLADENDQAKLRLHLDDRDVPDPWGRPHEAFSAWVEILDQNRCFSGRYVRRSPSWL
jgi:hypothetical protein